MMWHGKCYRKRQDDVFPMTVLKDEDGIDDPCELEKFQYARNGDHLMAPFQCDLCHSRNIQGRDPSVGVILDKRLLTAIRQANIDAFWGRSKQTVASNWGDVKQIARFGMADLGIKSIFPDMGPHPLRDEWGMVIACTILQKTLQPGMYGPNVQFDMVRKLRSGFSNLWGASKHTMTKGVMTRDTMKIFVTECPTHSLWFKRFIRGMHARMGDDRLPDTAILVKVMHALMEWVEQDYQDCDNPGSRRYIVRCGLYFMAGYLGSLRGEETPRIVRKYFYILNNESLNSEAFCPSFIWEV